MWSVVALCAGCQSMSRSAEENAALKVGENSAVSDEDAIEQIMEICVRPGVVMDFELNGDPGDYGAYIKYERTAATLSGSQEGFREMLKRELGRVAVCAFRATEKRGLELIEYDQKVESGPVVMVASVEREAVERVPNWRDTSLSPWVNIGELHLQVAAEIEIHEDWVHTLMANDQ